MNTNKNGGIRFLLWIPHYLVAIYSIGTESSMTTVIERPFGV